MRSVLATLLFLWLCGCGANEGILKSGKETPASSNAIAKKSTVETDVADMRTANFVFIYVVRRRDGGTIDAEDRSVLRVQTTEANRRIASEDGKAVVIGANGVISPEKMAALQARFAVEDYSPPPSPHPANTANANK